MQTKPKNQKLKNSGAQPLTKPKKVEKPTKKVTPLTGTKNQATAKFNAMDHWKGMPEFKQLDAGPIKSVIVNFETKEDMHRFSKLVNQPITAKTRSIWYPEATEEGALGKRWADREFKFKSK